MTENAAAMRVLIFMLLNMFGFQVNGDGGGHGSRRESTDMHAVGVDANVFSEVGNLVAR